jgi:hypothetical protein
VETAAAFVGAFGDDAGVRLRVHGKWADADVLRGMEAFRRRSNVEVSARCSHAIPDMARCCIVAVGALLAARLRSMRRIHLEAKTS